MPSFLLNPLLNLALPAIVTALAAYVYQNVKKGTEWLDKLPGKTHDIVFAALAVVLPLLNQFVPDLGGDIHNVTLPMVQSLVSVLVGKAAHTLLSKKA